MEPRLRNSSGPVEAMPKHKQAGHTTVLTKMRKQHNKTLAMQVPPTQADTFEQLDTAFDPILEMGNFEVTPIVEK